MSDTINVTINPTGPVIDAVVQGGGVGPVGPAGSPGSAGASVNLQVAGGYIQWQHVGDSSWTNLIAVSSLIGATGATGPAGSNGSPGAAGASVNLQVSGGYIQWQHVGDSSWNNLIAVSSLVGATGAMGAAGSNGSPGAAGASVNLQVAGGYIQWQHVGDSSWTNLIAVSSLQGAAGSNGQNGSNGASVNLQVSGGYIQWQHVGDSSWTNLIAVSSLVGATGATGSTGAAGSDASVTSENIESALGYTPVNPSSDPDFGNGISVGSQNLTIDIGGNLGTNGYVGASGGLYTNNSSLNPDGSASFADGSAGFDASGNLHATNYNGLSNLFPLGSSAYADGGTGANPARYIIQDQSSNVIGYVNLSWDGSPTVLIGIQATDASNNPLTHGTFAMSYDGSGNLTSVVCSN